MDQQMLSLADQVFDELEKNVLTEVYKRGEIITEMRLCEQLGVSRTPVREAMLRLEQEHLIENTGKGARVIGVSLEDIADIYDIRLRIEGIASRKAACNRTEEGLRELKEALEVQEFYTAKQDPDGIKNMDSRFHQILYRLCGSAPLRYTLEPLHRRIVKYRKVSISEHSRAAESLQEHKDIYDAIERGDGDAAERLTVAHIEKARDSILNGKKE